MKELLTIKQVAQRIGLGEHSVYNLCKLRRIRHMRIGPNGSQYRIRPEWIDEYLESCIQEPEGETKPKRQPKPKRRRLTPGSGRKLAGLIDEMTR